MHVVLCKRPRYRGVTNGSTTFGVLPTSVGLSDYACQDRKLSMLTRRMAIIDIVLTSIFRATEPSSLFTGTSAYFTGGAVEISSDFRFISQRLPGTNGKTRLSVANASVFESGAALSTRLLTPTRKDVVSSVTEIKITESPILLFSGYPTYEIVAADIDLRCIFMWWAKEIS